MSDLFADLGSFRFPDTRMNQGPLPSVAGGPAGTDGTVDGRINHTNELLRNITPYAFGQAARMGSDRNYQQVPHRVQQMVQEVAVPNPPGTAIVRVPHVVDNGELAFVVLSNGRSLFSYPYHCTDRPNPATIPQFANLEVVNYVLCNFQMEAIRTLLPAERRKNHWHLLFQEVTKGQIYQNAMTYYEHWYSGPTMNIPYDKREFYFHVASFLTSNMFIPFGICAGSDKQGGQHEGGFAPVQAAVNYVTTMTVDGQNRDLMNYWHAHTIHAGDRLILALRETVPPRPQEIFSLNSYYKEPVTQTVAVGAQPFWQLKAQVYGCADGGAAGLDFGEFDYRRHAYWHVAQTFQCRKGDKHTRSYEAGPPLQVTFSPALQRMDEFLNGVPRLPALAVAPRAPAALAPGGPPGAGAIAARALSQARVDLAAATAAALAVARAQAAAAALAARAVNARALIAAARGIPACIAAEFAAIPELHAMLLFYGIYVLQLNGNPNLQRRTFSMGASRDLFDMGVRVKGDWETRKAAGDADATMAHLIRTINLVRASGTQLLNALKLCNYDILEDLQVHYPAEFVALHTDHRALIFASDFEVAQLNALSGTLTGRAIDALADTELLAFITRLCSDPWLYMDKGFANNALLRPCLSLLGIHNLCALIKEHDTGNRSPVYDEFDEFKFADLLVDGIALTRSVNAAVGSDASRPYYDGRAKMQRCIHELQLDVYATKLKIIDTIDARSTHYFASIEHLVNTIISGIVDLSGQNAIPAVLEFDRFIEDCTRMSNAINLTIPDLNNFNGLYNAAVGLLRAPHPDHESIILTNGAAIRVAGAVVEIIRNMKKQRLIWTMLYSKAAIKFFGATPNIAGGGGPNHALYQAGYYTPTATNALMIAVLETIRNNADKNEWVTHTPRPVLRFAQTYVEVRDDVIASFPFITNLNHELLEFMIALAAAGPFELVFSVLPDILNLKSLQTFEKGKPEQFSLNTALGNVDDADEPAVTASVNGGAAAPKAGAAGKAVVKRAKKIRFEVDDERCPTIAEDAGSV